MRPRRTRIHVGQRLIRWDGVHGYVDTNTRGVRIHDATTPFQVLWDDGESEYLTLDHFQADGVTWGKGTMRWAR